MRRLIVARIVLGLGLTVFIASSWYVFQHRVDSFSMPSEVSFANSSEHSWILADHVSDLLGVFKQDVEWKQPDLLYFEEDWHFDLFTPPRIYIHPLTGEFEPTSYQFQKDEDWPELEVLSVNRPKFRYQLTGFVEKGYVPPYDYILLVRDLEQSMNLRLKPTTGKVLDGGYSIVSFDFERNIDEQGCLTQVGYLRLLTPNQLELKLVSGLITYQDHVILSVQMLDKTFELNSLKPVFVCDKYEIKWLNSNQSDSNSFSFQILNLQDKQFKNILQTL